MVIIFLRVLKIVSWWIESSLLVHLKAYKQPTDAVGWIFFIFIFGLEGLELVHSHPIFGVLNQLSRSWRQCCGLRLPNIVCTKCCDLWSDYFFINYSLLLHIELVRVKVWLRWCDIALSDGQRKFFEILTSNQSKVNDTIVDHISYSFWCSVSVK